MAYGFSTFGALLGLAVAIVLIIQKAQPAYSLIFGALLGGIVGGGTLAATVDAMVSGAQDMMPSVLRIMTSGILAGALIKTGSAKKIAGTIVGKLGERRAVAAIAIAAMIVCAAGVFVDIAVITVAPIALAIGKRAGLSKGGVLLAMIGGGKAGNIISPNPNTIAASEAFSVDLTSLMLQNAIPAVCALVVTVLLASLLAKRPGGAIGESGLEAQGENALPGLLPAVAGPLATIALLALRPIAGIGVDPLIALPLGGAVSILATKNARRAVEFLEFGLGKVIGVCVLLIGTGTIAGIIKASALQADVVRLLEAMRMPAFVLAPLAGVLMGGATASTTAGATIASQTFAPALLRAGVPALSAAAMIHAGATVLDSLPHGSFFHATGGAAGLSIRERMKLIPYEACIGLTSTLVSAAIFLA